MRQRRYRCAALVSLVVLALVATACGRPPGAPTVTAGDARVVATYAVGTSSRPVPPLPFADNPDPTQCGIPTPWGKDDRLSRPFGA